MKQDYQVLLEDFLKDKRNRRYAAVILNKLTSQHRHGVIAEIRNKGFYSFVEELERIIDYLVNDSIKKRRYTASILPTMISPQQAPNFWFKNEKEPTKEEIYRLLYIILTGLYRGNLVINLDNIDSLLISDFREWLISKETLILPEEKVAGGLDTSKIMSELNIRSFPLSEFGFTLLLSSYFSKWLKEGIKMKTEWKQKMEELGLPSTLSDAGINDTATLIVCNLHRQKKEMHIFSRFKEFILRWYGDFLRNKTESIDLILFLSSIYVRHKDYREISEKMMDKFIYYLLRGSISGELLVNLVNLKVKYELKERKGSPYPIQKVREFLRMIY